MTTSNSNTPQFATEFEFDIQGMTCASCSARVERILKKFPDVQQANVNLATERANIFSNGQLDPQFMIQAIEKAGYQASLILPKQQHVTLEISGMTCASCVGRVERLIKKNPLVTQVSVNLATESADIQFSQTANLTELLQSLEKAGYPAKQRQTQTTETSISSKRQHEADVLWRDFLLSLIFTLPIFILEMGGHLIPAFHHWVHATIGMQNSWLIQFTLCSLLLITAGRRFYQLGLPALLRAAPDMNSLVAVGTLAAYLYSVVATFLPAWLPQQSYAVYYESAAVIITLILLGRYLEAKAKGKSSQAIEHLIGLQPKIAHLVVDQNIQDVPLNQLQRNDIAMIKPGEKIPFDGQVIVGESYVDESMMTGESIAISKKVGDQVLGGTVNQHGSLHVKISAVGADTVLANIIHLVEQAQGGKLPIQTLVDKVTLWFVPIVMLLALISFAIWYIISPTETALSTALIHAVAVLIIACPCAMGLATPTSIMVGTGRAAALGVFFRHGEALQQLQDVKVIAFDKTGTLTQGKPTLTDFITQDSRSKTQLLQYAASLEAPSEHPIAYALNKALTEQNLPLLAIDHFKALAGFGVQGQIEQQQVFLGADRFMASLGFDIAHFQQIAEQLTQQGKTPFYFAIDQRVVAVLAVADQLKPESLAAIRYLQQQGIKVAMISGDNRSTAEHIAQQLNIDHVVAEVLPHQKVETLSQLKQQHGNIAFVGDGINDAPALAHADVGIAIGTGTDVAIEAADLVLMSGNIFGVVNATTISTATMRNIKQNLFWAFIYNAALIPVAMGALSAWGITLSPMLAAAAMALSSVFVISNALRLTQIKAKTYLVESHA